MSDFSEEFDAEFDSISHYRLYPELKAWVGSNFKHARMKILILGESHYLPPYCTEHHDAVKWYGGQPISSRVGFGWMNTRKIIVNGIRNGWKERSKSIYRNIEAALFESEFLLLRPATAFTEIAYMNYFQRPAEITGESINVSIEDTKTSASVVNSVVTAIEPNVVMFTSTLAWKSAKSSALDVSLFKAGIHVERAPHPGMPWWNRSSKKYGGKTGKRHFVDQIDAHLAEVNIQHEHCQPSMPRSPA